jgi:hypothetical protein
MKITKLSFLSLVVAACGGGSDGEATSEVTGAATYRDAATDHQGNPQLAAAPASQNIRVFVTVEGQGELPELDPECALDTAGQFEARYTGTAQLADDAVYAALFGESSGQIVTPSGCEIPDLTVGLITDVRVRAELTATAPNCDAYCSAEARADAEESCGASPSAAECRVNAEASGKAQCVASCSPQTHVIVAETSLAASALGDLDADALRAAAFGELQANLVFDHVEQN